MQISMYRASVPNFVRMLDNLAAVLAKGAAHAEARGIDPGVLVQARLYPDMFPLARQVQIATDTVKGCAARLAGGEVPSYADTETSFPELQARIGKTREFLESFAPADIDGSEERPIELKLGRETRKFTGIGYLFDFVIPNFYFHVSVAYGILRHCGVEIGKADYLAHLGPAESAGR